MVQEAVQGMVVAAFQDVCRDGGKACWDSQQAYSAAANLETPLPLNFLGTAFRQKVTAGAPASQKDGNEIAAAYSKKSAERASKPRRRYNPAQLEHLKKVLAMPPAKVRCR